MLATRGPNLENYPRDFYSLEKRAFSTPAARWWNGFLRSRKNGHGGGIQAVAIQSSECLHESWHADVSLHTPCKARMRKGARLFRCSLAKSYRELWVSRRLASSEAGGRHRISWACNVPWSHTVPPYKLPPEIPCTRAGPPKPQPCIKSWSPFDCKGLHTSQPNADPYWRTPPTLADSRTTTCRKH